MLCIQKCDMHLFQTEEQKGVYCLSGLKPVCFFTLDPLFKAILECCEGLSASQVVQVLADQYEAEEIVEAIEELAQVGLISDGTLPVVSDVPTTEGGSSLWGIADRSFAGIVARFPYVQYPMRLLLCSRRGLRRQGHADATRCCRASHTLDHLRGSDIGAMPD